MNGIGGIRPGAIAAMARLDNVSLSMTNSYGEHGLADPTATLIAGRTARDAFRASTSAIKTPGKPFKSLLDIKV